MPFFVYFLSEFIDKLSNDIILPLGRGGAFNQPGIFLSSMVKFSGTFVSASVVVTTNFYCLASSRCHVVKII